MDMGRFSETIVYVENAILVSTVVYIVQDKNPLVGVIQYLTMTLYKHIADTSDHKLN